MDDEYTFETMVGHGAHGTTYRATRLSDGSTVAVKELLVRKVESLKAIDLFQRETRVLEQLRHSGIPTFIADLHVDAGRSVGLYLVQEFIDGETLETEFETRRATRDEVFELAAELLDILDYTHGLSPPVIHRDIKPGNIMRRSDGTLVLIDFGSVRDAIDTAEGGSTVAGTFGYMAPEQFAGRAIPATDIYGVGATIVALLSRLDPQKLIGSDRTIEWRGKLGLNETQAALLEQMLEPDPDDRANDARDLAEKIRAAQAGEWTPPDPVSDLVNAISSRPPAMEPIPVREAADLTLIPPAPRPLPDRFRKKYAPSTNFHFIFGGAFTLAGVLASVIPMIISIADGKPVLAVMSLLFFVIFGGIGLFSLRSGFKRLEKVKDAYQNGVPAEAIIVDIGSSTYQINNRAATVYTYELLLDGKVVEGEFHSWEDLDLVHNDSIVVLYVAARPESNVLYCPEQYQVRRRRRRQVARTNTTLSFPEDEAVASEEAVANAEINDGQW